MSKKYLITGAAGFIGANLVRQLLKGDSSDIHIIEPIGTDLWRLRDVMDKIMVHSIDLADFERTTGLVKTVKPDIIFHLASFGGMPAQQDRDLIFKINVHGTINLLEACKFVGFECFINTGSSSEYGKKNTPMKETDVLEPISDYAVAKAAATHYCLKEALTHALPIYTIRPFSVYGDYEAPSRLIPTVLQGFLTGQELHLSSPSNVRDFIYIDDMVNAYLMLAAQKPTDHYIFNIGSGVESRIAQVVDLVRELSGTLVNVQWQVTTPRPWEPLHWQANIERAQAVLGWQPIYSLKDGLARTMAWFENNQHFYSKVTDEFACTSGGLSATKQHASPA